MAAGPSPRAGPGASPMTIDDPTPPRTSARTAPAAALLRDIPSAPAAYLADALENPDIGEEHVVLIARSRAATTATLQRIGADTRWRRSYEIKAALVLNPRMPHPAAMNFVKFLFWRDLARVSDDPFLFPPLRRLAEKLLTERIADLALGEKVALARTAGRALIPRLFDEEDPLVLEALLWNGRVVEGDLLRRLDLAATPPATLEAIARHPRWTPRHAVRLAAARNPRTPRAVALGLLTSLRVADLEAIAASPDTPDHLRLACRRVLADEPWRRRKAVEEE